MILSKENIESLNEKFREADPVHLLKSLFHSDEDKIIFSSSMGAEDQVITDMLCSINSKVRIITLDTGRLFPETYAIIDETRKHYRIELEILFPDREEIEKMVKSKGINLFYESVENRRLCCYHRKIVPLKRVLTGMKAWITGIRKDQTLNRFNTRMLEWDETYQLVKINPLYRWTEKMVWDYIKKYQVPYNELHDKGFPSIGCQPCTRSVKPGDDPRSGRWWWEDQGHRECGLHIQ